MEKTIEIQLAEHGERIAQAIENNCIENHYYPCGCAASADMARTTK